MRIVNAGARDWLRVRRKNAGARGDFRSATVSVLFGLFRRARSGQLAAVRGTSR